MANKRSGRSSAGRRRLDARLKDFTDSVPASKKERGAFHKPGSVKK